MDDLKVARGLGWASLGIAAVEILGQGAVEKDLLGIHEHPWLMPAMGVREATAGLTILSQKQISPTLAAGLWSRVAGDALDISLLAAAAPRTKKPMSFAVNVATVLGITALDIVCAWRVQKKLSKPRRNMGREAVGSESREAAVSR